MKLGNCSVNSDVVTNCVESLIISTLGILAHNLLLQTCLLLKFTLDQ